MREREKERERDRELEGEREEDIEDDTERERERVWNLCGLTNQMVHPALYHLCSSQCQQGVSRLCVWAG